MVRQFFKKKSKRMTCRLKYKIAKKVREHHRKQRREARKTKKETDPFRLKKPIVHVPNKCPFKADVLLGALKAKDEVEEWKKEQKELLKKGDVEKLEQIVTDAESKLETFKKLLAQREEERRIFEANPEAGFKAHLAEVKKVINEADVIIEVLDARDPLGSRCSTIEKEVIDAGKRLVLLMNKIDLVPAQNVYAWLAYFRKELPTIAFKASTQQQNSNLGRAGNAIVSTKKCIGTDLLLNVLGNYCRNRGIKTVIRVGIVGYPNVGKSSVINSLKRSAACMVGAVPGVTRSAQEVHLSKKVWLIDTPGVVFASRAGCLDKTELALKNAFRIEKLEDPILPISAVLRRCTKDKLILHYDIADFKDVNEFLGLVARKIGKLRKGGVPDLEAAAKRVLLDWNNGRIRYHTVPPETYEPASYIKSEVVSEMGKEFNLDELADGQTLVIKQSALKAVSESISLAAEGAVQDVEMDDEVPNLVEVYEAAPKEKAPSSAPDELASFFQTEGNQRLNHDLKLARKKMKKKKVRSGKLAEKLSDRMEAAVSLSTSADYDFNTDFT